MFKRPVRLSCVLASIGIVAGFFLAVPYSFSAGNPSTRLAPLHVYLTDTGKTVVLPVGHQLVVTLPLQRPVDNTWRIVANSGGNLKLIAGPDELHKPRWDQQRFSEQVFYFVRESPGTAHLVLEKNDISKPMVLEVVDR